jgi:hypothetical protein
MQVTFYLRDTGWLNRRKTGMKFSRVSTGTGYMTGQETGRKGSGTGIRNQESCKRHDLQFCSGPTGPGSQLETHRFSRINEVYGSVSQAMDEEDAWFSETPRLVVISIREFVSERKRPVVLIIKY